MRLPFELDPQIVHFIIHSQAGSIGKALIELLMNSVDAGATLVRLNMSCNGFECFDMTKVAKKNRCCVAQMLKPEDKKTTRRLYSLPLVVNFGPRPTEKSSDAVQYLSGRSIEENIIYFNLSTVRSPAL